VYAELHCISNFSFLRGASHPPELVERAVELGYSALALTDECSVAGVVRAHTAAKKQALQFIVGSEFRLETGPGIVVLATTRRGYGNLCRLITRARLAAEKGSYRLTRQMLAQAAVADCLADCLVLWLPEERLAAKPHENPRKEIGNAQGHDADDRDGEWLASLFPERLWIAVELVLGGNDRARLARLTALGARLCVPLVATGGAHMHIRDRRALHDVLTAIRLGVPITEAGRALAPSGEQHLRTLQRLQRLYPPELLAATLDIAARCRFSLDELRYEYPQELVPEGESAASWLRKLTEEGVRERWPEGAPRKVRDLIEYELALVTELRYEQFFLTVRDLVHFARSRGILCQGRGSAANSVICYALGVTSVDPARQSVLFERFISRERNEPPDIDVDFEHERREEVIQYVYAKYGRHRAALAATVITYQPRSALRDVGKAMGFDLLQVERLARTMHWWDGAQVADERIRSAGFDPANPMIARLLERVHEILGFPRHLSQHVGGFVISQGPLEELVPIENAAMPGRTVIEWDKDDLDDLGLLKVDVLGLGMLTAIRRAFDLIEGFRGRRYTLASIPAEDPEVYEMIQHADTVGVFQIESRAQMSMLPRLRPANFYDIVIEVAIVRPGPIQGDMVHPYLRRRNREEPVDYPSDAVRTVLERTLGVPIFQEQVMQLAIVAAGFSPGEADDLRRSMAAWKRRGGLEHLEQRLRSGMRAKGYSDDFASRIFRQIQGFGEYGFPECVVGDTRVIDADTGRWLTIDDLVSGRARIENTLACDPGLRLRKRRVLAVTRSGTKPVWCMRTALGHSIVATAEHPFMTMKGWRKLGKLQVGDRLAAARTPTLAGRRIYWDKVTSIEPAGRRMTYDLQVEGDHNFLANHLIVHNSHAASFALLVYASAWIKRHEPAAFTCALLNSLPMGFYAPAQLVRDARAHGVEVRPVDVHTSTRDCALERREDGEPALRLGLRLTKNLSRAGADRLVAARVAGPFTGVQELAERAVLGQRDLDALAAAGVLARLSGNRHRAAWQVAGIEAPLPLLGADTAPTEGIPMLAPPSEGESIVADYRSLGLTLGRHPLALLRERLRAERISSASELKDIAHGKRVRAAGIVITRQRPSSASGVTFVTLEDETGHVNLVVWAAVAETQRRPFLEAQLLEVHGQLQREGEVMHVIAERLIDKTRWLGALRTRARNFH